jgi:hypothetical protein
VKDNTARDDQAHAQRERVARERLVALGPGRLERRPWQPAPVPPSAIDLVHAYLWWAGSADQTAARDGALAALELLGAARDELDQIETSLLFTARGLDLTWAQMARAMGLNSPQACQQRLDRLMTRRERPAQP